MLSRLSIRNYALIESLQLDFPAGLTIITGETGAGKSIMLGALSLLLGARADSRVIADPAAKSVVEARFTSLAPSLSSVFDRYQLDWDPEEAIVRREISANGRSRAFINDSPVNLQALSEVVSSLVDIHSQNSTYSLMTQRKQLEVIDAFAGNGALLEDYHRDFEEYRRLHIAIRRRREQLESDRRNMAIIAFQLEQLDKLDPKPGELERIEKEFDILSDADEIRERLGAAYNSLEVADISVLSLLSETVDNLRHVDFSLFSTPDSDDDIMERLSQVEIELKDISETLRDYYESVDSDPVRLSRISKRMQQLYEAEKYFKISEKDGLVKLRESLRKQADSVGSGDSDLAEMEADARRKARELKMKANTLSERRREGAGAFARLLTEVATPLGLPNLNFEVAVTQGKLSSDGQDTVEFLCGFNKNQTPQPISKVASGGELSRLMLSVKCIMAGRMEMPTVIFDEIDTGVSGEIADKMGDMMRTMAEGKQVIAITHLPQVAAKGIAHFYVYKEDSESRTVSSVRKLSPDDRLREIARMISGSTVTPEALGAAKTLLNT